MNIEMLLRGTTVLALSLLSAGCSQGTAPPPESRATAPKPAGQESRPSSSDAASPRIPSFHQNAEAARPFPRAVSPERFEGYPVVQAAYRAAAKFPEVLVQQPCYCHCDRSAGHGSLADCWANDHGAG